MDDEDEELFCRTMYGVMKNIAYLCKNDCSDTWGKEAWKKVVVCIISDGRSKINPRTLFVITAMGAYQDDVAKNVVNGKLVAAHVYEYTTQIAVSVTPGLKIEGPEEGHMPVQIIFCLKEKNQKKINSHRWFFNAFAPILNPNVCVLLDAGTIPGPASIYHLWKSFEISPNVGGAYGEMLALKSRWDFSSTKSLLAAQNPDYKRRDTPYNCPFILAKTLEPILGHRLAVSPSALSAYRYIALQNDWKGEGPLQNYFLGEEIHGDEVEHGISTANKYLAEDRILCWELVSKRGVRWISRYVEGAYAVTDVPDEIPELISQRRRWLNGSFFAAVHSTIHSHYIHRSAHSIMRKFLIRVEVLHQLFSLTFSWLALANYYIAFAMLSNTLEADHYDLGKGIYVVNILSRYTCLGLLVICFVLSLGNRPQRSKRLYTASFLGFAVITIYMMASPKRLAFEGIEHISKEMTEQGSVVYESVRDTLGNSFFTPLIAATLGLCIVGSGILFKLWHIMTSSVQYLLIAPSHITVLNVYAFANVYEVWQWGTKGDVKIPKVSSENQNEVMAAKPTENKDVNTQYEDALHVLQTKPPKETKRRIDQEDYHHRMFRTNVLLAWAFSNALLAAITIQANGKVEDQDAQNSMKGLLAFLLFCVSISSFEKGPLNLPSSALLRIH
ncbi:hypothetical protein AAF712_015059 [Marasmius tenuissimus]|uniref:Chitin synthase n=1 Tax=Marasmius tenuissimus TaxID=585030 RepID=A0ABR2Z9K4_9AGAR